MKKIFTLIAFLAVTIGAMAQGQYFYEWKDGKYVQRSLSEVDSITFSLPESPEKEYKYVDLGLPSGTLWADRNVGADSPEAYGDYFAWGETTSKSDYNWNTYKWSEGSTKFPTKYCGHSSFDADNKTVLDLEDDAAYVNMGTDWRMPTYEELCELYYECTWTWTTLNGTNGYTLTGHNGKSIFLPAAGYCMNSNFYDKDVLCFYWSSSLYGVGEPYYAWSSCYGSNMQNHQSQSRYLGLTVRAVVR